MRFQPKTEQELAASGLLPAGEYDFEVVTADETTSKAGNEMVALKVKVYTLDGDASTVFDYLVSTDKAAYKIRQFAEATNLLAQYERGELPADVMVGRTGRCKVVVTKGAGYPDKNSIAEYLKSPGARKVESRKQLASIDDEIPF